LASLVLRPVWIEAGEAAGDGGGEGGEGRRLASELRESPPPEDLDVRGLIRIREGSGQRRVMPFRYRVVLSGTGWTSLYETSGGDGVSPQRLMVVHREGHPNEYILEMLSAAGSAVPTRMTGDEAMVRFAGSDFWLADLGLEYLHWPEQEIREDFRITRRKGRPCQVLESRHPSPAAGGYAKVLSWIDRETGRPIIAEAYGADGEVMKEFEVGGVTKVDGVWQLKNLEMRDLRSDSRTVLEFRYEQTDRD